MSRKLRSLVVDDDPTTRLILKRVLRKFGEVDEAEDGVQALLAFREALRQGNLYHLVTLDVMMPEFDGIATLECLRGLEHVHRSRPKAKILMMTGVGATESIVETIRVGSNGYLLKPIDHVLLKSKVCELFNLPLGPRPPRNPSSAKA